MPTDSDDQLYRMLMAILRATSKEDVQAILRGVGDRPEVGLDQAFGPLNLQWHPFGDNLSNFSTIGLGTKPGRSLTERLTNAMDAVLEDRCPIGVQPPHSPRLAAQQWFGRPVSGPEEGLFTWPYTEGGYDRRISVVLNSSGIEAAPTVDVVDEGIGLHPSEFPLTILSLQTGNKIKKWYLIGAFGQGGASSLGFCDFAIIVSHQRDNPRVVGFTVIKVLRLDETYKEDSYAYLACMPHDGKRSVPSCTVDDGPLAIYQPVERIRVPEFRRGTLVRHLAYGLSGLSGQLSPSPGNLYHYLHYSMFDPLFPFRLIDLRDPDKARDELVTGSRNRLMKLWNAKKNTAQGEEEAGTNREEKGSEVRWHRPMEFIAPLGTEDACIGIEYWVVPNYRKGRKDKPDEVILRAHSNELYVQRGYPIVGTLNGQNQGELSAQILRELGLGMVARHIVIHIDASKANTNIRRALFATSREGFKDGAVLENLKQSLRKMLEEDGTLVEIEKELTARLAGREAQSTDEEIKRRVVRLLMDAGMQVGTTGPTVKPGIGEKEKEKVTAPRTGRPVKFEPLPTLPFPEVTIFKIVSPKLKMQVPLNDNEIVLIETDADAEYDRRGLVAIRTEPDYLEQAAKSPLRGGRLRWRLRPRQTAKVGNAGKIVVTLTRPDGSQLTDTREYEVIAAVEEPTKKAKGFVPPFDILPINPDDDPQAWSDAWPDLDETADIDARTSVAYKQFRVGNKIIIYYSTIFAAFKEQMERLKESPALSKLFETNYAVWIGYHAILQETTRGEDPANIESEVVDKLLEADRSRVGKMQVRQAMQIAELTQRVLRGQDSD